MKMPLGYSIPNTRNINFSNCTVQVTICRDDESIICLSRTDSFSIELNDGKSVKTFVLPEQQYELSTVIWNTSTKDIVPPYQSGAFNATERKISKRGNSYLRKTGYEIMQSLIKHKPVGDPVYDFIQKKRSEGKCGKEAMIAGLNKFLRVYYGKVMELYSET